MHVLCVNADGWGNRWVKSDWKKDENLAGEWNHTSGQWNGDANDKGKLNCYIEQSCIISCSCLFLAKIDIKICLFLAEC